MSAAATGQKTLPSTAQAGATYQIPQDFSDRWNPLFVREVRRMLKSSTFTLGFLLMLVFSLFMFYFSVAADRNVIPHMNRGGDVAFRFLGILLFIIQFAVPLSCFQAVGNEHQDKTIELTSITSISTYQLLHGYICCALVHMGLYVCAVLPFISVCFLMGGLGLGQLLASLSFVLLVGFTTLLWGLCLGASVRGNVTRVLYTLLTVSGSLLGFGAGLSLLGLLYRTDSTDIWVGLICSCLVMFPLQLVFYSISSAHLQLYDPLLKPYRVKLNDQGEVVQFLPRYSNLYVEVPEWHQRVNLNAPQPNPAKPE